MSKTQSRMWPCSRGICLGLGMDWFKARGYGPGDAAALESDQWDVILCDYSMPSFNALAALEVLKELGLDIPFIIISGTVGETVAVEAMRAGAHDYLMKITSCD